MKSFKYLLAALLLGSPLGIAQQPADLILHSGRITTRSESGVVQALAIQAGRVLAIGDDEQVLSLRGPDTQVIDLDGRAVIPGLNDSHLHAVRGGRFYNLELRWDGIPTLALALSRVAEQALRTPEGHWVRVVGGWSPFQFVERRMPTIQELNLAAPKTPVFVLFLYSKGFINRAGVEALGLTPESEAPPGTRYRFVDGGVELLGEPSPALLYKTISKLPGLTAAQQLNSTRHFYRELNRFGLSSCVDPGGGGHDFPRDYSASKQLAQLGQMPMRVAYYLFAQVRGQEAQSIKGWTDSLVIGVNEAAELSHGFTLQGAGENLIWAAGDYENFLAERPVLAAEVDAQLESVVRRLLANNWPIRIHATYNETVERFLDVFERASEGLHLAGRRWALDHVETITPENIARIKRLGGGVAIQDRMAFAGEYFVERYGAEAALTAPPLRQLIESGLPLGAGTDGTRVSSYNPWVSLAWMVTGKTVGGLQLYAADNLLTRAEALGLYTQGSAWFSGEDGLKGRLVPGQMADLAVLSADFFSVPEQQIASIESVLTIVGGQIVYGAGPYQNLGLKLPPVQPAWSPVAHYGGYFAAPISED